MALADIKNWISGETEAFFDPLQTSRAAARVDSNPGGERLTERASIGKFVHLAIAGVIGAFASVALVYFVVLMRNSVEPSRATDAKSQSSGSGTLVTGGGVLGDVGGFRPNTKSLTEIPTLGMPILNQPTTAHADARLATAKQERRPAAPQRASRRDRPRDSASDQAEREETARLMRDELQQRGVAADAASGSGHPE
jgi:hypothetical protein